MNEIEALSSDQSIAQLTVGQLRALIAATVQDAVRQEFHRDYYVNEQGVKVLYTADQAAPAYLAELQQDYEAIPKNQVALAPGEQVLRELGLGADE